MKNRILPFLCIGLTYLISCTPNESILTPNDSSLPSFVVKVEDRAPEYAIISWTDADDPFTNDTVFYDVFIDSVKVSANLTRLVDTILNLELLKSYSGLVVAFTHKGDTASAPFTIEKLDGMVVFGESYEFVQCYSLYTDLRVWRSDIQPHSVLGSPVIVGDTVFCSLGGSEPNAFSLKTGERIWGPAVGASTFWGGESPVYENGTLYVSHEDGLAAVNTKDGTIKWNYTPGIFDFFLNPVVGKDYIYSGSNFEIHAIKRDGSFGWKQGLPAQLNKNPTLFGNTVIVVGCSNGRVYGISQTTGAILWNRNFSVVYDNFGTDNTDPIVYNNLVIIQSGNHGIYALNPSTGATIWELPGYSGPSISSPTIGNDILYYNYGGQLIAIEAATGTLKWSKPLGGGAYGNIIYANGRIYSASGPWIDVLDANTGGFITRIAEKIRNKGRMVIIDKGVVYYSSSSGMLN